MRVINYQPSYPTDSQSPPARRLGRVGGVITSGRLAAAWVARAAARTSLQVAQLGHQPLHVRVDGEARRQQLTWSGLGLGLGLGLGEGDGEGLGLGLGKKGSVDPGHHTRGHTRYALGTHTH